MNIFSLKLRNHYRDTKFIIVNFSENLSRDTENLNQTLKEGWKISDKYQFESSIVYELWKWKKKK